METKCELARQLLVRRLESAKVAADALRQAMDAADLHEDAQAGVPNCEIEECINMADGLAPACRCAFDR